MEMEKGKKKKDKPFSKKMFRRLDYLAGVASRTLQRKESCYPCRLSFQLRTNSA